MSETTNTTVTRAPEPLSPLREFWHYFRRNKGALIGLIYILLMLLIAVLPRCSPRICRMSSSVIIYYSRRSGRKAAHGSLFSVLMISAAIFCRA